ncbi:MAG: ABC transporter ATP-binding protein [Alphaproteobacteria bacterium]|nr:ABC transporter ATP-binding protein [Alphaproteobacteria bacterium]
MTAAPALLSVENLTVVIGGAAVVDRVSFEVGGGQVVAIVGESGCGKSMTAFALMDLLPAAARRTSGRIELSGRPIQDLGDAGMRKLRGKEMSIIFQEPVAALDPLMTVGDQLIEAIRAHHDLDRAQSMAHARKLLESVGITDADLRLKQYPFELSGGMCQRVMIAGALAGQPRLLIADEPTTALDVTIQAQILELIKARRAEIGASVILITHDMGIVADMADRVLVMYAGRIVEEADAFDLFARPRHPYTEALMKSVPRLDDVPGTRLPVIEGAVPRPGSHGPGCRFADRCFLAIDRCRAEEPGLLPVDGGGRRSACWRRDDVGLAGGPA